MKFNDWYKEFLKEDKTGLSDRELLFIAFTAGETKTDEIGQVDLLVKHACENCEIENDCSIRKILSGETAKTFSCNRYESKSV